MYHSTNGVGTLQNGTPLIRPTSGRRDPRRSSRPTPDHRQFPSAGLVIAGGTNDYPPPAVERQPALWREVEPDPLEVVVLRGTGGLPKSSPGGGAERTPAGRGRVCPGRVETPQQPRRHGELTINPQTTHRLRHHALGAGEAAPTRPNFPSTAAAQARARSARAARRPRSRFCRPATSAASFAWSPDRA